MDIQKLVDDLRAAIDQLRQERDDARADIDSLRSSLAECRAERREVERHLREELSCTAAHYKGAMIALKLAEKDLDQTRAALRKAATLPDSIQEALNSGDGTYRP